MDVWMYYCCSDGAGYQLLRFTLYIVYCIVSSLPLIHAYSTMKHCDKMASTVLAEIPTLCSVTFWISQGKVATSDG